MVTARDWGLLFEVVEEDPLLMERTVELAGSVCKAQETAVRETESGCSDG